VSTPRPAGRLPAALRIRKRPEFQEIQAQGRRVTTPHFVLLLYARALAHACRSARLGVTVSRKVGKAVVRNRAKRLVREAFRATHDLWAPDVDLVVIVRKVSQGLALAEVVGEWRDAEKAVRRRAMEARKDRERRESKLAQRP
jgi:ribonuclease P protein component